MDTACVHTTRPHARTNIRLGGDEALNISGSLLNWETWSLLIEIDPSPSHGAPR